MLLTQSGESSLVNDVIANAGGIRKQSRVHLDGEAGSRLASRDYRLHELGGFRVTGHTGDDQTLIDLKKNRLFTVIIIVVGVLILAVLSVVGFLTTKYVARQCPRGRRFALHFPIDKVGFDYAL
jgi:hypothetical protein